MNDDERRLWVLNDEGLYWWYRQEHCSMTTFIRKNRAGLTEAINWRLTGHGKAHDTAERHAKAF